MYFPVCIEPFFVFSRQDELSDFTGSKSATPMSTTASDMEREDGNSRSTEVQAAPGTRSISVGKIIPKHSWILLWVIIENCVDVSVSSIPVLCVVQVCLKMRITRMCKTSLSPPLSWIWTSLDTNPAGNPRIVKPRPPLAPSRCRK